MTEITEATEEMLERLMRTLESAEETLMPGFYKLELTRHELSLLMSMIMEIKRVPSE